MKLATWNVNSIRARQERVLAWIGAAQPDVLCMQELKAEEKAFPLEAFHALGYQVALAGQRTYNGVAIASKKPMTEIELGLGDGHDDPQARLIAATIEGIRVVCAYMPNGQEVPSEKYDYKLRWMERLRVHLFQHYKAEQPLVLCGDFNVAPEPLDVYDPDGWVDEPIFHVDARQALQKIEAFGLTDVVRARHPEQLFSYWDYRMLAFPKNRGLRIDHIFCTPVLAAACTEAWIDRDTRKGKLPSDHAAVLATFAWPRG